MKRWWDDPDYARGALERVDGSDVAQGVGTALLGYHALAKAMVADLPGSTLVDPALVWSRLEQLDLEPVAKALASATAPLMGEASVRYGQLLAADVHEQSLAGLETLMAQMGATGLPMPMIVERAVEVVGVPARHMGAYAKVAKERVVPPVVKADAADRALMLYASHLGAREATGPVPEAVEKAAVRFREEEHPRDGEGQFATKEGDPRRERVERRARRVRRAARATSADARDRAEALSQASSLADMARALAPREQVREQAREKPRTSLREIARQAVRTVAPPVVATPAAATPVAAPPKPASYFALTEHLPRKRGEHVTVLDTATIGHREQSVIVPMDVAEQIANAGGFTTGVLEMMYGGQIGDLHLFSADSPTNDVWSWASVNGITANIDLVVLTFDGPLPVRAGDYDDDQGIQLATDSRWELTNAGDQEEWVVPRDPMGPLGKPDEVLPVLRFSNANAADYEHDQKIIKAHAEKWEGRGIVLVSRNPDGEFATEDHARVHLPEKSPDVARRERAARRARRGRRALRAVSTEPEQKTAEVARELVREKPRAKQRSAERAVSRVFAERGLAAEPEKVAPRPRRRTAPQGASLDMQALAAMQGMEMSYKNAAMLVPALAELVQLDHPEERTVFSFGLQELADTGIHIEPVRKPVRELVADYVEGLARNSYVEVLYGYNTRLDAIAEAQMLREDALATHGQDAPVFLPHYDPAEGWGVRGVDHEGDPPVTFYGDPKAMKLLEQGGEGLVLEVVAEDTGGLARHHHVPGAFGDQDVRVMAVKVSLPHDGEQTSGRSRRG